LEGAGGAGLRNIHARPEKFFGVEMIKSISATSPDSPSTLFMNIVHFFIFIVKAVFARLSPAPDAYPVELRLLLVHTL
jgi:hypothetical protein